jgi:hypothetical protein
MLREARRWILDNIQLKPEKEVIERKLKGTKYKTVTNM